jgi:hypothetical protein
MMDITEKTVCCRNCAYFKVVHAQSGACLYFPKKEATDSDEFCSNFTNDSFTAGQISKSLQMKTEKNGGELCLVHDESKA